MTLLKLAAAYIFFALLLLTQPVGAETALKLDGSPTTIDMTPYLHVLEDPAAQFGADDLRDGIFNARFEPLFRGAANYGFSRSDWWVRFTVRNATSISQNLTFKLDYPLLDHVDVWVLRGKKELRSWQTGNRQPFSTRAIEHRDFLFPLLLSVGDEQTVYVRVRTQGPVNIGVSLFGEQALAPMIEMEYLAFGAYFGGFLLLALCISLLYLVDRQPTFLYYLAYILSYGSYMMAFNGLAFQYLWPDAPEFGQVSRPVLLAISIILLLQFSSSLLNVKKVSTFLHRCVVGLQTILGLVLIAVPLVGYGVLIMPLAVFLLLALFIVIAMGVMGHIRGERGAKYYLTAWAVFLVGLLLYLLKVFGLLPHTFITHYGFQLGSVFEFIFLSAALGARIKEFKHPPLVEN